MAANIIPAGQFNPAALTASGLYISIVNPPSFIRGVPTDVIGVVGTASWGPVNKPVHLGSGQDVTFNFGTVGAAALTDYHDLATDLGLAFKQAASQASLEGFAVRVTDGTDTAATSSLVGAATAAAATATIGGTVAAGTAFSLVFTSTGISGSPVTLTFTAGSTDTVTTVATALAALVNSSALLVAARIYAKSAAGVVTVYPPTTLTPSLVLTGSSTAAGTVTIGTAATSTAGLTLSAMYTGVGGNNVQYVLTAGVQTNTFNLTIIPPYGGNSEIFAGIPGTNFWSALASAVNSGLSAARGPSAIVTASAVNIAVGAPTTGTATSLVSLAGGTDGRAGVTTATLLGSDVNQPRTGLYALRALSPAVGIAWIAGCVDQTIVTNLQQFADTESVCVLHCFPSGTSSAAAQTLVATIGVADAAVNYVKDWIWIYDQVNSVTRLVPPTAVIGGMWATYSPEQSLDNKPVYGVIGTERNGPTGNQPYTLSEIGGLQSAGISIITNPINAGAMWGTWGGRSCSNVASTQPSEYWRMTSYLARSIAGFGGKYVSQLQSAQQNDSLRKKIKTELNNFFQGLVGANQIDSFLVLCEVSSSPTAKAGFGTNTPQSIAQHYLYALCQVTYLSSVWFFIVSLEGGTTVTVQTAQAGPTA